MRRRLAIVGLWLVTVACQTNPPPAVTSSPTASEAAVASAPSASASAASATQMATGPVSTRQEAARRATPVANAALAAAYTKSRATNGYGGPHPAPWVDERDAHVTGNVQNGWTVSWAHPAPAGFECAATISVSGAGAVRVVEARASFSPD